jgi:hypothetical protein
MQYVDAAWANRCALRTDRISICRTPNHLPRLINLSSASSAAAPALAKNLLQDWLVTDLPDRGTNATTGKSAIAIIVGWCARTNEILSIGSANTTDPRPPYQPPRLIETLPALHTCGGCGRDKLSSSPVRGRRLVTILGPFIVC